MKAKKMLQIKYGLVTILFVALIIMPLSLWANNLVTENISITGQNTTDDYTHIQFDISWENSWRTDTEASNWDAAWVFAKWKLTSETDWAHCTLSTTDADHTAPTGSTIDASFTKDNTGRGVFIYNSSNGSPLTNDWDNVELRWNYGADGVPDGANVDVKVFGIEMVYVPEGSFWLGDGSSYGTFQQTGSNTSVQITTDTVSVKASGPDDDAQLTGDGILVDGDGGIDKDGNTAVDNADYPTGYKEFYCMKYEISQGQWTVFLNTLTSTQAFNRYKISTSFRYAISEAGGIYCVSRPDRALNNASWDDGCAYTDWAGLRPMTELEFEKACRGPLPAVAGEYAWGTNSLTWATTISGFEDGTETITNAGANCNTGSQTHGNFTGGDGSKGPLRCGIFATGSSDRESAGATYYGIMEMTGNVDERSVTLGNLPGRVYTGAHGDGVLDTNGDANVTNWPGGSSPIGIGRRGADFYYNPSYLYHCISSRRYGSTTHSHRDLTFGFRAVRSLQFCLPR